MSTYKYLKNRLKDKLTNDGKLTIRAVILILNLLTINLFIEFCLVLLLLFK